ncbi:hypothetical protein SRU_1107 [Salinibacter ruber DSM 13855]|uniref:Uncharacterized protein n=1 Tax=Salinibacter ruber (strain DSM 13855 / M31) TaxID=309807 RepID=Q2S3J6_SALRD|nr:hypothetical protein SRU_1107 [Salinibacter ruber DSM 13855]
MDLTTRQISEGIPQLFRDLIIQSILVNEIGQNDARPYRAM